MRSIPPELANVIRDARAENLIGFTEASLEKDVHISAVLNLLPELSNDGYSIIFCGGTSLIKAHRLIDRMSEDVDLKVAIPDGVSVNSQRKLLGSIKQEFTVLLESAGFGIAETKADNNNFHFEFAVLYESQFAPSAALRNGIKIEFTKTTPRIPTQLLSTTALIGDVVSDFQERVDIECLSLEETLAEKVVSYLRRTLPYFLNTPGQYEDQLVRHIYDVYKLRQLPLDFTVAQVAARHAYLEDSVRYKNASAKFILTPRTELLSSLDQINRDYIESNYTKFVEELLSKQGPDLDTAIEVFKETAHLLLD